jgi:hypothetical protein
MHTRYVASKFWPCKLNRQIALPVYILPSKLEKDQTQTLGGFVFIYNRIRLTQRLLSYKDVT